MTISPIKHRLDGKIIQTFISTQNITPRVWHTYKVMMRHIWSCQGDKGRMIIVHGVMLHLTHYHSVCSAHNH